MFVFAAQELKKGGCEWGVFARGVGNAKKKGMAGIGSRKG